MKCEAWVLFVLETQDRTKGLWLGELTVIGETGDEAAC